MNGFFFSWIDAICFFRYHLLDKPVSQILHWNGFFPSQTDAILMYIHVIFGGKATFTIGTCETFFSTMFWCHCDLWLYLTWFLCFIGKWRLNNIYQIEDNFFQKWWISIFFFMYVPYKEAPNIQLILKWLQTDAVQKASVALMGRLLCKLIVFWNHVAF